MRTIDGASHRSNLVAAAKNTCNYSQQAGSMANWWCSILAARCARSGCSLTKRLGSYPLWHCLAVSSEQLHVVLFDKPASQDERVGSRWRRPISSNPTLLPPKIFGTPDAFNIDARKPILKGILRAFQSFFYLRPIIFENLSCVLKSDFSVGT